MSQGERKFSARKPTNLRLNIPSPLSNTRFGSVLFETSYESPIEQSLPTILVPDTPDALPPSVQLDPTIDDIVVPESPVQLDDTPPFSESIESDPTKCGGISRHSTQEFVVCDEDPEETDMPVLWISGRRKETDKAYTQQETLVPLSRKVTLLNTSDTDVPCRERDISEEDTQEFLVCDDEDTVEYPLCSEDPIENSTETDVPWGERDISEQDTQEFVVCDDDPEKYPSVSDEAPATETDHTKFFRMKWAP